MAKRSSTKGFYTLLDTAERDPLTTPWERRFLASIRQQTDARAQPWLSEEQSRTLARIALKIGVELPARVRALVVSPEHDELMTFAMTMRGDPRLTAWEEGFLANMVEVARIRRPLTEKQRAVLERIRAKVAAPLPEEEPVESDEVA